MDMDMDMDMETIHQGNQDSIFNIVVFDKI